MALYVNATIDNGPMLAGIELDPSGSGHVPTHWHRVHDNPFSHHTTIASLDADWLARRARLDKWQHVEERAQLAVWRTDRADEIRKAK